MKKTIVFITFLTLLLTFPFSVANAAMFNSGLVLTDSELSNKNSMSMSDIKNFLNSQPGILGTYADMSVRMYAYQIIYDVAQAYSINPKYILVLLQKEQGLLSDPDPSEKQIAWATGYSICDDCSMDDPKLTKYQGLANQIDWGAGSTRYYMDHPEEFKYQIGETYTIDGQSVTMGNNATRALYTYTPHIHGNELLFNLWNKYFSLSYPDGVLLQNVEDGGIWLIQNGKRRPFTTRVAFASRYSFDKVITVKQSEIEKFEKGVPISYANYSLLQTPDKKIYLLEDDQLKLIASDEAFRLLGFNPEEVEQVTLDDIAGLEFGDNLDVNSSYPTGALLQDNTTGGVYYVKNGSKYPIWDRKLIFLYYSDKKITPVSPDELIKYTKDSPVKLKDGELVKSSTSPQVYFISNGSKRPINSVEVFESLGFEWKNIIEVSDKIINLHPLGSELKTEE